MSITCLSHFFFLEMHSNSCSILRRAAFDYTEIDILHYKMLAEQKSERLSLVCFICMLFPVESDQYVREWQDGQALQTDWEKSSSAPSSCPPIQITILLCDTRWWYMSDMEGRGHEPTQETTHTRRLNYPSSLESVMQFRLRTRMISCPGKEEERITSQSKDTRLGFLSHNWFSHFCTPATHDEMISLIHDHYVQQQLFILDAT